ncbi:hypothetical protein HanRHA438_Chr09g0423371 [Helianthus annuus]|nr:hypothetical protein HanRHA438_Chr09g0423371 [Helianthus annuus]
MLQSKNLSGRNSFASSHTLGSLAIAHALTITLVPFVMSNPKTLTSWLATRGTRVGMGG